MIIFLKVIGVMRHARDFPTYICENSLRAKLVPDAHLTPNFRVRGWQRRKETLNERKRQEGEDRRGNKMIWNKGTAITWGGEQRKGEDRRAENNGESKRKEGETGQVRRGNKMEGKTRRGEIRKGQERKHEERRWNKSQGNKGTREKMREYTTEDRKQQDRSRRQEERN